MLICCIDHDDANGHSTNGTVYKGNDDRWMIGVTFLAMHFQRFGKGLWLIQREAGDIPNRTLEKSIEDLQSNGSGHKLRLHVYLMHIRLPYSRVT